MSAQLLSQCLSSAVGAVISSQTHQEANHPGGSPATQLGLTLDEAVITPTSTVR